MKKLTMVFAMALLAGALFVGVPVFAQEGEQNNDAQASTETTNQEETTQSSEENVTEVEGSYNYVAQEGDSYTQIARKAIQTYGIETQTNLSGAQIVFAETNMTIDAGSPELNVGEKVEISKKTVKNWVEKAQKLSKTDEANWDYYVQFVDFNTDSVGQAS